MERADAIKLVTGSSEVIRLYQRHGLAWARDRDRQAAEAVWLDRFLALVPDLGTVLDLGCGSGWPVARYLLDRGSAVVGVDTAPDLLALAWQRCPEGEWHLHDMRSLDLQRAFQGVLAWNSFFHLGFDDQRRMFPIFRAHAANGAPLMFTSGPAHGEAIGSFGGEPLYHASLDAAEYRRLLVTNGFEERAHVVQDPACNGLTVWLAQAV